ncbi:hypothetical protein EVG20_g8063 [Dentipellis fragilis]|uniref:Uncharacterized protein n=1 Tax=Dentipellis fragilis TaxID=205917 RepID=A0A4Y9YAA3_9AGAM|nr:hypothetical protein EVG20_g8063 [Dentipellis fragilis]
MAVLSKALDDAGIPNFQWGDHLNQIRYCRNASILCGLVVAASQLETATSILSSTELCPCNCSPGNSCGIFNSHPPFDPSIAPRVHFTVPSMLPCQLVFLCANEDMLHLIPLTPSHPNPASLEWDEYAIQLYPNETIDGEDANEIHVAKFLTARSIVKVLMICLLLSPANQYRLYRYPNWMLNELGVADKENSHVGDLGSAAVNEWWEGFWKALTMSMPLETAQRLRSAALQELQTIVPNSDRTF